MGAVILFLAAIASIVAWWLSQQRLTAKPWLEEGVLDEFPGAGPSSLPTAKIGLGVFLAVVGSLFALLISSYSMRLELAELNIAEWHALPVPKLLWLNTFVLVLSSVALQWAVIAARRGQIERVKLALLGGGITAFGFLAGQLIAWHQLTAEGFLLASSPAKAFFYLITGIHGAHILGGLVALGRTASKVRRRVAPDKLRLSVELCAMYWHFLLLVWLILFGLFAGWADDVLVVCRGLLS